MSGMACYISRCRIALSVTALGFSIPAIPMGESIFGLHLLVIILVA